MKFLRYLSLITVVFALILPSIGLAQDGLPRFEPSSCPIEVPADLDIDCGYLIVPEDYQNPERGNIRLPILIIRSTSKNPAPDPVLFTEGGPGMSSLKYAWGFAESDILDQRDIIIFEQRGNRYADPSLECNISMWLEEGQGHTPCLDSIVERGIDPALYTTQTITADINALRQALDYEAWNLYSTSYSTRLMQLMMRDYPEGIHSVILQSVSRVDETRYEHDPEHTVRVLNVMFQDCAADPDCAAAYPDLESRFYELFSRLNANPVPFEVELQSQDDTTITESVDGYRMLNWMITDSFYGPAYPPAKTAYLPLLIDQVEKGLTDLLYPWLDAEINGRSSDWSGMNWGLFFAVNCQDDASSVTLTDRQRQIAAFPQLEGFARQIRELEICEAWGLPAAPPLATELMESDIPTLVLAGAYDPITPPEWSKAVADNLAHSYYYEFPASGHSVNSYNPCAEELKVAFINNPTTEPDTSCMSDVPGSEFVLPSDVLIMDGLYGSIYEVSLGSPGGDPFLEAIFAGCILLFMAEIVYLLVAGIIWIVRRNAYRQPIERLSQWAQPMAGLVVLFNIGFFMVWGQFVYPKVLENLPITLYFGVPVEYAPMFIFPIVAFALTVGLVVVAVLSWKRGYWTVLERVLFSLVTLAAMGFAGFLIRWDVLTALF